MKKLYLVLISVILYSGAMACSFTPDSFCRTMRMSDDLIISGRIVAVDTSSIDVEIIEIIRGEESRDIIRIWNGTDFECNGLHSMAALTIGGINDTVIIILPLINEIINQWDVIGDYRRPEPFVLTSELRVKQGIVKGLILGDVIAPPEYRLLSMDYEEFKTKIVEEGDCSTIILSNDNIELPPEVIVTNPFSSELNIQLGEYLGEGAVVLYSTKGERVLMDKVFNQKNPVFQTDGILPGLYILEIRLANKLLKHIKVVKL